MMFYTLYNIYYIVPPSDVMLGRIKTFDINGWSFHVFPYLHLFCYEVIVRQMPLMLFHRWIAQYLNILKVTILEAGLCLKAKFTDHLERSD
jgi:hypothetical protein